MNNSIVIDANSRCYVQTTWYESHHLCATQGSEMLWHGLAAIFCYIISVLSGHFVPFSSTLNQDQILAFVYALFTGELPNFKDELHLPECAPPFRRLLFPISPSPSPEGCRGVWALTRATRLGKNASGFTSTHSSNTPTQERMILTCG